MVRVRTGRHELFALLKTAKAHTSGQEEDIISRTWG